MDKEECGKEDIEEFTKLIEQFEHAWKPTKEELELIDEHNKRELKIGMLIAADVKNELVALLREYTDIFE
jgi:chaperonin cofactor prefoldin